MFDSDAFNHRLFFPRGDRSAPPDGAIEIDVEVPGARLHVRWHRPASDDAVKATVLLFHGNGEVVSDYDDAAALFAEAGAALAVMDYRGYGRSTGAPTLRTTITDAAIVLEALAARVAGPLIVMGRSLGSACAIELYGRAPARVAGYVLESGASDLLGLVERRGLRRPMAISAADRATVDPLPKLARGTAPLLVLHGADDELIDAREAVAAHATAGTAHKRLVLLPGRGHNDIAGAAAYWTALAAFVTQVSADAA